MPEQEHPCTALTDEKRRLVRDNLGLVAVHLRRIGANHSDSRLKREWDDLFQEGCLGLIRAALAFRAERGIPFPAFALPRIHNAVSRALLTKFNIIYVPPPRPSRNKASSDGDKNRSSIAIRRDQDIGRATKTVTIPANQVDRAAHRQRPEIGPAHHPTVGQRIRDKYERAVNGAARAVTSRAAKPGDRHEVVRALIEDRFMIPEEESRRPLRGIARDHRSSYGRVVDCDNQLRDEIRRTLEADPEFLALRRLSRTDPIGMELSIDEKLERDLANSSAAEFTRRFAVAPDIERARMLQDLLEFMPCDLEELVRTRVAALPPDTRERLLRRDQSLNRR